MKLRTERFLDLYVSESRDHLRLLIRSILSLESGVPGAVEDAFRAAHTLKGLASAMGHAEATAAAHSLEDRLAEIRAAGHAADPALTDDLLSAADAIEAAIERGLSGGPSSPATAAEPSAAAIDAAAGAPARPGPPGPAGAGWVFHVRLAPDTPLPEARIALIRKGASSHGVMDGEAAPDPETGEFRLWFPSQTDTAAAEAAIRRAGDVEDVRIEQIRPPATKPAAEAQPPAATVRVDRARLDELAEGIAELSVLHSRAATSPDGLGSARAAAVLAGLQRTVLELRMVPVSTAFERLARVVRDTARTTDREADFDMTGGEIELDQAVLDALVDPLLHLLRNAVGHGLEPPEEREASGKPRRGTIRLEVIRERSSVRFVLSDDGRGINVARVAARGREMGLHQRDGDDLTDDELHRILFHPGFSTADAVTELSGRGVGLDIVGASVRALGGAIELTTTPGEGTTFTLRVPVTLALAHALRIRVGVEEYALPLTNVSEVVALEGPAGSGGARTTIRVRGDRVPLVDLAAVLRTPGASPAAAVVAELGGRRVALAVDQVLGHEQIVVKNFDAPLDTLPIFAGATLLPDGRPALLIDPLSVL